MVMLVGADIAWPYSQFRPQSLKGHNAVTCFVAQH